MKKIIEKIILIFILISAIYVTKVYATGSFSISASKTSINKGESVTINISGNNAYGEIKITATNATVSASSVFLQNDTKQVTVTSTSDEDIKVTASIGEAGLGDGDENPINEGPQTITINVKKQDSDNNNADGSTGNTGGNTNTPAAKSTEARLKNLEITPNDFTGFRKDTYRYTHEVPNSVSKIKVVATTLDSKAKVTSGNGDVTLKEGNNTIEVVVKAEAGNTQKYTLTIKRRTAAEDATLSGETSDASLKSLGIKPEEYDFSGFQKDKTEYSVEVPEEVEEIEVYAEATNPKAQINGTGKVQLKNGKNKIIVQVTAEDGTTRTYTLEVTRGGTEATETNDSEDGFGLSSLKIKDLILSPDFKTGTYEYTIELTEDLSSLDIEAIATDEDATIEIIGNENLQQGENTITILVRNEETDETATYQIMVNKNVTAEEEMSWLKPSTWGREEIIKVAIIAVLIILIIIAIILKVKIAKEKKSDEDFDLPGGEELDKALAEHQELEETAEFEKIEMPEERNKTEEMTEIGNVETSEGVDQIEENEISKGVSDLDGTNYIEDIARSKNYKLDYQDDNFNNSGSRKKGKHF